MARCGRLPRRALLEDHIVQHLRFDAAVISAHQAKWATDNRREVDVFGNEAVRENGEGDIDLLATLRTEAIAKRVQDQGQRRGRPGPPGADRRIQSCAAKDWASSGGGALPKEISSGTRCLMTASSSLGV